MAYETILFDIDGTLCDPGDSIIESARFALGQLGVNETDEQALRRFVGPPLEHSFKDYYDFDDAKTGEAVKLFREKLTNEGIELYKAYDGIPELLEELTTAGKRLAIVTSKIDTIARLALKNTGLIKYFEVISTQKPDEVVKKEVVLSRALDELRLTHESSVVMVGDRKHDIEAAKNCEIDSIGVLWGYGSAEEFAEGGATHIVTNTQELKDLLV